MKHPSPIEVAVVTVFLTAAFATTALTQTTPAQTTPAQATSPQAASGASQGFAPGFDDLMTMVIQPRHIKLYYAGSAKNWELAAAESRDLRSSFDRIAQAMPKYENNDVSLSVRNFITSRLDAVDTAIAGANSEQFAAAYKDLTTGCNECHTYMEHPFLVIQIPNAAAADPAHSDQDFNPSP